MMRRVSIGLILLLPLGAASATPAIEAAVRADTVRQKTERLAESEEKEVCPTSYEVRSYIWIEPKTGREYRMLNFYCPGLDEA
jgi:hypothetical protein